jgi:hypothetical protein
VSQDADAATTAFPLSLFAFDNWAFEGVIEPGNHIRWICIDGVAQADEYLNGRSIFVCFEHADVFAGYAGACRDLFLGETGFQSELSKFFSEHDMTLTGCGSLVCEISLR